MQHKCFISVFIILVLFFTDGIAQDDYSVPIKCYSCYDRAQNSSCADPIDNLNNNLPQTECLHGVCVKMTKYEKNVLMMHRTCSAKLNIHIMLVNGVCRRESYGNGYLCMCGKHLCNEGSSRKLANTHMFYIFFVLSTNMLLWFWWRQSEILCI